MNGHAAQAKAAEGKTPTGSGLAPAVFGRRTGRKFLLVPGQPNRYDRRMMQGLAQGLKAVGQEVLALRAPLPPAALVHTSKEWNADVVVQVNRLRPQGAELGAGTRHIGWFQDVFPSDQSKLGQARAGDILYFLGDGRVLGLNHAMPCLVGSLVTGVDESLFAAPAASVPEFACDYSLVGFIPPPSRAQMRLRYKLYFAAPALASLAGALTGGLATDYVLFRAGVQASEPVLAALRATVEAFYRPLSGELDINALSEALVRSLRPLRWRHGLSGWRLRFLVDFFAREYPRLLDRQALMDAITDISESIELYGPGWEHHAEYRGYHRGVLNSVTELSRVYRASRINLANNTHGLGLHSRNLECMAVGGFILTHASPNDAKPGGMHTSFEPGVHYGSYTPDTLKDEARRWLRDEKARVEAGARAREIVRAKHLWRHRAQQILDDLER